MFKIIYVGTRGKMYLNSTDTDVCCVFYAYKLQTNFANNKYLLFNCGIAQFTVYIISYFYVYYLLGITIDIIKFDDLEKK